MGVQTPKLDNDRLRQMRHRRELSAEKLGRKANVSTRHIWRLEAGDREAPWATTLARIALALGTSVEYLLGITDDDRSIFALTGEGSPSIDFFEISEASD